MIYLTLYCLSHHVRRSFDTQESTGLAMLPISSKNKTSRPLIEPSLGSPALPFRSMPPAHRRRKRSLFPKTRTSNIRWRQISCQANSIALTGTSNNASALAACNRCHTGHPAKSDATRPIQTSLTRRLRYRPRPASTRFSSAEHLHDTGQIRFPRICVKRVCGRCVQNPRDSPRNAASTGSVRVSSCQRDA